MELSNGVFVVATESPTSSSKRQQIHILNVVLRTKLKTQTWVTVLFVGAIFSESILRAVLAVHDTHTHKRREGLCIEKKS